MALVRGRFDPLSTHPLLSTIRKFTFLDMETGPWVAGGSARRLPTDEPHHAGSDVDVFFPPGLWTHERLRKVLEDLPVKPMVKAVNTAANRLHPNDVMYIGKVAADFEIQEYLVDYVRVQFVFGRTYASLQAMLDDFDYTVCLAATDGHRWVADERFFPDVVEKALVIRNPENRRYSLSRLARYCSNGFTPKPGVLAALLELDTDRLERTLLENKCSLPGDGGGS